MKFQQHVKHYSLRSINLFIDYIWSKENLPVSVRSPLSYHFTRKVMKLTSIYRGVSLHQLHTKLYGMSFSQG
jgi:hypothetical protein